MPFPIFNHNYLTMYCCKHLVSQCLVFTVADTEGLQWFQLQPPLNYSMVEYIT